MSYARHTTVSPERSMAEIETLLRKYGADAFVRGWEQQRALIQFRCSDRQIRFELPLPRADDDKFRYTETGRWRFPSAKSDRMAAQAYEQEVRRLWRALVLVIKAKLEAVESGITTFENEFMAHIVMPDGKTVGEHIRPRIADAYAGGKFRALLPGPGETA